jgi:hypothetical protein
MDKIAQGVTIQFTTTIGGSNPFPGGQGTNYIVTASNVPVDVVKQALQECNGQDNPGNGFTGFKCDGTETAPATFMLLYDQTR